MVKKAAPELPSKSIVTCCRIHSSLEPAYLPVQPQKRPGGPAAVFKEETSTKTPPNEEKEAWPDGLK